MSKGVSLYLLTTTGCSLCEKAKQQLWPVLPGFELTLEEVDIVDHPLLLQLFATRIPVISLLDPWQINSSSPVLGWPFDQFEVAGWLAEQKQI